MTGSSTDMKTLGLIPAKGKSTRLKRKNVIEFCGKPMLAWSIEAALESGEIDDLVVSTEDEEIAVVAKEWGAEVPFMRPEILAVDPAGVEIVALDALERLENLGRTYDRIIILLATSPLRNAHDIKRAAQIFEQQSGSSLMSVTQFEHSPYSAYQDTADGLLEPVFPKMNRKKSQELPPAYRCNGAIHVLDVEFFKRTKSYTCAPLLKYEMPQSRSVDIDTSDDLFYAVYLKQLQNDEPR